MCSSSVWRYNAVLGRCLMVAVSDRCCLFCCASSMVEFSLDAVSLSILCFSRASECADDKEHTLHSDVIAFYQLAFECSKGNIRFGIAYFRVQNLLLAWNLRCSIMNGQYGDGRVQCWCCSHWSSRVEADSSDAMLPAWCSQWRRFFYIHTTHKSPPYGVLR